jgi:fatty-acyl-CoA synthase
MPERGSPSPMPSSRTLAGVLDEVSSRHPSNLALIDRQTSLTYAELRAESERAGKAMLRLGVKPGEVVAALISNRAEWVILAFAAARIGAVFAPLNTWYQRAEIEWALRHLQATMVVAETRFLKHDYGQDLATIAPELRWAAPGELRSASLPSLRSVVHLGERRPGTFTWEEFLDLATGLSDQELAQASGTVRPDDLLFVLFTSGSTAEPKAVSIRHAGTVENCFNIGQRRGLTPDDRVWLGSALFYGLGAVNALPATISHGATLVLQGHFEAGEALNVIESTRATVFYGMSNMIRAMYEHPAYRRDRVASLVKGTASISVEERRILIVEMGVHMATQSYGMTETYGNCTGGYVDDPLEIKLTTVGQPLPGWDLKVVDPETMEPLATGATGLLLVRGYVTDGYYGQPQETAEALTDDGYLITGDLCSLGKDGYVRYHSRLKEMIKTGGINVSPLEVEQLLLRHPAIRQAYVVGVPDRRRGEVLVAFVEADSLTEDDVKRYVRERAASFKVPSHVFFRKDAEIPRVASGKVPRFRLREEAMAELGNARSQGLSPRPDRASELP